MKPRDLTLTALFAGVICVFSPWSFPIGAVPVTLATFAVYVASAFLGKRYGPAAVAVYLLLGAVGLPVFSGFTGGFQRLFGVTGGYLVGYLPCSFITGWAVDKFGGKKLAYPLSMLAGTIVLYAFGLAWFMGATKSALAPAVLTCVLPFLPFDAVKLAAASAVAYKLRTTVVNN